MSWRDGINFKPQSINAAARPAGFGDQIKEGIDKVGGEVPGAQNRCSQGWHAGGVS